MQIMLLQDVDHVGRAGEIVEVKNGFGRNYLLPKKLAVVATPGALKQAEQIRAAGEKRRARELVGAQALASSLAEVVLEFRRKVGERGRLYGSVTTGDIAEALAARMGSDFERRRITLEEPLKALGSYEVPIAVHAEVPARIRVEVIGENGETAADYPEETVEEEPIVSPEDPQPLADY